MYLVGRYGRQVEDLWEGRVKNGLFQLIASPGSHTYPVFELSLTPELVKGGGGVFGSQAYLARNTSLDSPPSVGIMEAGRYHEEADVLQHFEEVLVETVLKHEQFLDGYDSEDLEDYYNVPWLDHGVNYYDDDYEWPADYDSVSGNDGGQTDYDSVSENDGDEMDYDSVSENAGDEVTGDRIIVINDEGDQAVIFVSGNDDPEVIIVADEGDPAVIFVSGNGDPEVIIVED